MQSTDKAVIPVANVEALIEAVEKWLKNPPTTFEDAEYCVWDLVRDPEMPGYAYTSTLSIQVADETSVAEFTLNVSLSNFCSPTTEDTIVRSNDDLVTTHYLQIKLSAIARHAEAFTLSGIDTSTMAALAGRAAYLLDVADTIIMPRIVKLDGFAPRRRVVMWSWRPLLDELGNGATPQIEFVK